MFNPTWLALLIIRGGLYLSTLRRQYISTMHFPANTRGKSEAGTAQDH